MKLNVEEIFDEECKGALDYYSWHIEYKDIAPIISARMYEIAIQEYEHAMFWFGILKRSGNKMIETYEKDLDEVRNTLFEDCEYAERGDW